MEVYEKWAKLLQRIYNKEKGKENKKEKKRKKGKKKSNIGNHENPNLWN